MKLNTIKTQPEDKDLVRFLQAYHPVCPPENKPCERMVMRSIIQEQRSTNPSKIKWLILLPSTVVATLLVIISGNLIKSQLVPQLAQEKEDLETFLVNTWNGSISEEHDSELYYLTLESEF